MHNVRNYGGTFSDVLELVNTGVCVNELISLVQPLGATR